MQGQATQPWALRGRTVLITGATAGIGRATARALAGQGAELVLLCRDAAKGEAVAAEIRAAGGRADLLVADLAVQGEVRRAAADYLAGGRPLHVLINNAGVVNVRRTVTVDGIETTLAVNHLAPFLLTTLLLDRLCASAPARVVTVASEAHKLAPRTLDDLQSERRYRTMQVYGLSKLANILFTSELARRLAGSGVTANCLHPGAVATALGTNNGAWARALIRLLRPFFRTAEQGAATTLHLAADPGLADTTGGYFADCRPLGASALARDPAAARYLWSESERLVGCGMT